MNLNGKDQKKENQESVLSLQNVKNVVQYGKDLNQNVLFVKLNYQDLILKKCINHQRKKKKRKNLLRVVLHRKMKEKRKKNLKKKRKKSRNLKNLNVQVAKKNYLSILEDMVIDMDSEDISIGEKRKIRMLKFEKKN